MRSIAAILLANLPVRWWGPFEDRLPLHRVAWVSGLATMFLGLAIGVPGYITFMHGAADGFNSAIGANPDLGIQSTGWGLVSLPIYMFATPDGFAASYLGISGFLRGVAAYVTDEAFGDPVLTGLDAIGRKVWRDTNAWNERKSRERQEGGDVPDRLVTGEWMERPDIELAILAARRKDWPRGAYLVNAEGRAYRIGESFDLATPAGLRAVYPLTELRTGEAIRYAIPYELPPLWRGVKGTGLIFAASGREN